MATNTVGESETGRLVQLREEAVDHMERALALLDKAGLSEAAVRLDHAICLVPDAKGTLPRPRALPDEV